jgi:hypothetical protein
LCRNKKTHQIRFPHLALKALPSILICGPLLLLPACRKGQQPEEARGLELAAQVEAYKSQIGLSRIGLAKGQNYLGDDVFYVEGTVKNEGGKLVQHIELTFLFKDSLNQVVLKEARRAVDYKSGRGLEPQKSTKFQVAFDRLPRDWNYVVPEVKVTNVGFK